MKTIFPLLVGLAAFQAVAQNDPIAPPEPFAPPTPPTAGVVEPVPAPPGGVSNRNKNIKRSDARPPMAGNAMAQSVAERAAVITAKRDRLELESALPRSTKTGRTLVIQTSDPDPNALTDAEEDLSVMALILRKATGSAQGDEKRMALGIEVDSTVFGSSSGARNMYVEGYGAVFLLAVPFPLIAPPEKEKETKAKAAPSSDWAEAREEYLSSERNRFEVQLERVWVGGGKPVAEEYDADRVEDLKSSMLEALKNAAHIRALKANDHVTVVIQGAESIRPDKGGNRADASRKSSRSDSRRGETVMTMRVKKSDVDAFAKGDLDLAGFRKKAAMQTYFRRGDASVGTSIFFTPTSPR